MHIYLTPSYVLRSLHINRRWTLLSVLQVDIMFKFQPSTIFYRECCVVRNNTSDPTDIRWDVLKSMIDDLPQLWDRTERYLLDKRSSTQVAASHHTDPMIEELIQKAISEYKKERSRK
jgi:hypothetical protein